MNAVELVQNLDNYFDVSRFDESDGWIQFMPEVHKASVRSFYVPEFWDGIWNGLMLDNTETVDRIYLVVFPTAEVLDTVIAKEVERAAPGAMIFAHHPAVYHEREGEFLQIPLEQLEELREHQISYYTCHAPLDCHQVTSTGTALANALGLNDLERFGEYKGGLAGVIGTVPPITFQDFAERLAKACELPALRYDQILHSAQFVKRVAIVAGGGGDPAFIDEAIALGVDTYVTGHWHLFAETDFAREKRQAFMQYIPKLEINLLGASHYSSEMVVMREQMRAWFKEEHELEAILIRQEDFWGVE